MKKRHPILEKYNIANEDVVFLNLSSLAFEITGTEEKMYEIRRPSKFIQDRIRNKKTGELKKYVLLSEGYGYMRPAKLFIFHKLLINNIKYCFEFSNGLEWQYEKGDYILNLKRYEK